MSFTLEDFAHIRPYLYHLTSKRNARRLLECRTLHSAAKVFRDSGNRKWIKEKRREIVTITFDGEELDIRDQAPLYAGKTRLEGGWTFEKLIAELNERVFFWPGKQDAVISYGLRHYERYREDNPAILRVRTEELFEANSRIAPHFCKYNSGSPRTTQGLGSPRGPDTFIECARAAFRPANVVEVTFRGTITLPQCIEIASSPAGPWKRK